MAVRQKLEIDSDEFALGLCFNDGILMGYVFWSSDLTLEGKTEPELSFEQKLMFSDESDKLLLCTGRKLSKSILLESRILRIAVSHKNTGSRVEGLITVPSQKDMALLYNRVMAKFHSDPLIMSLIEKETGGENLTTEFRNKFVWLWRIEGLCLSGDAVIIDAEDDVPFKLKNISNTSRPSAIHTVDASTHEITTTTDYVVVPSGLQDVYRLTLTNGWSIKATKNHPFLTRVGWKELGELSQDDEIAFVWDFSILEWEKGFTVKHVGKEETYDVRVPNTNSLIANGFVVHNSGKDTNMRGIRAAHILGDEQQGSNQVCHNSRKMSALPGCTFLYAGVPDGVRSTPFFQLDQTHAGDGWSKHKYASYINPIFQSEEERDRLIKDNGGRNSMTYLTQVMGQWGDETVSSFPAGSISVNGNLPIFVKEYNHDMVSPYATTNTLDILFGDIPKVRCHSYAVGIDYGSTSDPTVMTFVYRRDSLSPWNQYLRLTFGNVEFPHLVSIIKHFIRNVFIGRLTGLCTDLIALVQTLISDFTDQPEAMRIFAAVPGGTTIQLEPNGKEKKDATGKVLRIRNKQYYHELLRAYMTNANLKLEGPQLFLGQDDILIEELRGTTERRTPGGYTEYYSSQMYRGGYLDHNRESCTYMCAAIYLGSQLETDSFSERDMLEALGFAGGDGAKVRMPWESENVAMPF